MLELEIAVCGRGVTDMICGGVGALRMDCVRKFFEMQGAEAGMAGWEGNGR